MHAQATAVRHAWDRQSIWSTAADRAKAEMLRRLVDGCDGNDLTDPATADALVAACEGVISVQNQTWMAELVKERKGGADPEIPRARGELPPAGG